MVEKYLENANSNASRLSDIVGEAARSSDDVTSKAIVAKL